jgi:hypothetical protein
LTFDWITLLIEDIGEGAREPYTEMKEIVKQIKIWSWALFGAQHQDELADRPLVTM